ncbi:ABATE domain-containing protein [Streptomyces roseoverticillatus]|uniref:CGNR zinc finger domain-containing protein n=1 Tax=Streptomyces roseoverticillatus TaxID=66429 RepID=UPI001F3CB232|nr:ABATE domain-containing protein [Streptomyces roseoverticillatus]MCF3101873.1 ABATE domain-containing protein [Streptomyces roseoverticillatus]
MTDHDRLAFRFDCGATWLNLLATRGRHFGAHPVERLATPERLAEWLDRSELPPARPPGAEDLRRAHELRETLRPVALSVAEERPPPAEAVEGLTRFLGDEHDPVRLVVADRLLREPPATAGAALARIARQAADHLTGPERHTLAICPEHDCRGVFANPTGRRRWCPSLSCASRGRVRAFRERRRTGE